MQTLTETATVYKCECCGTTYTDLDMAKACEEKGKLHNQIKKYPIGHWWKVKFKSCNTADLPKIQWIFPYYKILIPENLSVDTPTHSCLKIHWTICYRDQLRNGLTVSIDSSQIAEILIVTTVRNGFERWGLTPMLLRPNEITYLDKDIQNQLEEVYERKNEQLYETICQANPKDLAKFVYELTYFPYKTAKSSNSLLQSAIMVDDLVEQRLEPLLNLINIKSYVYDTPEFCEKNL